VSTATPGGAGRGRLQVGVFVPQGWKLEYLGWDGPDAWARSVELAEQAETLGYDHLWVYDHVETVPRRRPTHVFEAFTLLAALSQRTSRVGLGQLVTCASYRNVGLLAKEAACIDFYSAGRLILGLGAGWFDEEYRSYGYEYLPDRQRLAVAADVELGGEAGGGARRAEEQPGHALVEIGEQLAGVSVELAAPRLGLRERAVQLERRGDVERCERRERAAPLQSSDVEIEAHARTIDLASEVESTRARWKAHPGLSGVAPEHFGELARFLANYMPGDEAGYAGRPPEVALLQFIRYAVEDLRVMYMEARMQAQPDEASDDRQRWLLASTALGVLMRTLRDRMEASDDPKFKAAAAGMAR